MVNRKVLGIIFSNIHDEAIGQLTAKRATASIPFGGRYRLIDFTLSNMVNAGISEVGVITKQNYQSLMDHLGSGRAWDLARKREGLYILPPMSEGGSGVYRSKIEALTGIAGLINHSKAEYVLMADSNIIYNIDFAQILEQHESSGADITLAYCSQTVSAPLLNNKTQRVTVIEASDKGRVRKISFNPADGGEHNVYLNILILKKALLVKLIQLSNSTNLKDFESDLLMANVDSLNISGYRCDGYIRQIDSMRDYFNASMDLLDQNVRKELFSGERPIFTKVRDEVPAIYGLGSSVSNSLIADGAVIDGKVVNSIIFRGVRVGKGAKVENSILMQGSTVGENVRLSYVITDKEVVIKDSRMLMGFESYPVFIEKGSVV